MRECKLEIKIPPLDKNKDTITNTMQWIAVGEGIAWIRLKVKAAGY